LFTYIQHTIYNNNTTTQQQTPSGIMTSPLHYKASPHQGVSGSDGLPGEMENWLDVAPRAAGEVISTFIAPGCGCFFLLVQHWLVGFIVLFATFTVGFCDMWTYGTGIMLSLVLLLAPGICRQYASSREQLVCCRIRAFLAELHCRLRGILSQWFPAAVTELVLHPYVLTCLGSTSFVLVGQLLGMITPGVKAVAVGKVPQKCPALKSSLRRHRWMEPYAEAFYMCDTERTFRVVMRKGVFSTISTFFMTGFWEAVAVVQDTYDFVLTRGIVPGMFRVTVDHAFFSLDLWITKLGVVWKLYLHAVKIVATFLVVTYAILHKFVRILLFAGRGAWFVIYGVYNIIWVQRNVYLQILYNI